MPLAASLHNRFSFRFPVGFIFPEVEEKYMRVLEKNLSPFNTVKDFLNASIQNATIPGITVDGQEQFARFGQSRTTPAATHQQQYFTDKTISITMGLREGLLNWIILYENSERFFQKQKDDPTNLPDMTLSIGDNDSNVIAHLVFGGIQIESLSELEFNFTDNNVNQRTFDLNLRFNTLDKRFNL